MKFKFQLLFSFLAFLCFHLKAQDSLHFELKNKIQFSNSINWDLDNFGNILVAQKDKLQKIDADGKVLFEQSLKKFGEIASIDARNPMKILLFSEEQQSVFYVDNTLSNQENEIDLNEFDITYATKISASNRPDKIWVYDQENSKINLISSNKSQTQQIENILGLLDLNKVNQFFEAQDFLWILDNEKGIYQFDLYGTLISSFEMSGISYLDVDDNYLYILKGNSIIIQDKSNSLQQKIINLPEKDLVKFKFQDKKFTCETKNAIFIYSIDFF
jgi:hypothetical protein